MKILKFIDNLYFGPKVADDLKKVIRDLKRKKYLPGVWIITLPSNENNILDIVEVYKLSFSNIDITKDFVVVGISYGKEEAMELVRQIVDSSYAEYNKVDIKRYLGLE